MELVQPRTSSLLLTWIFKILGNYFFSSVHFFLGALRLLASSKWKGSHSTGSVNVVNCKTALDKEPRPLENPRYEEICMEELITVMDRLGMGSENKEENWENVSVNELAALFDEDPSWVEIQEVFEVFDKNKDGYIDAAELQRILCGLCIKEEEGGYELEECRKMLCAFDENGDGLIDFTEFVTFMEKLQ